MHRVRSQLVRDVFTFYTNYNILVENVLPNDDVLDTEYSAEGVDDILFVHFDDTDKVNEEGMDAEQENTRGRSDAWRVTAKADELAVLERRASLTDEPSSLMAS
ncbi:hypothetical protein ON010_g12560 [Phytophthora cinnamomi]|nr:hypothetical protein ON010_g12560 [Phytophthora cinnamomi]